MDANEYQRLAMRTAVSPASPANAPAARLLNAALGLAGEAGEVANEVQGELVSSSDYAAWTALRLASNVGALCDMLKKHRFHGHELPQGAFSSAAMQAYSQLGMLMTLLANGDIGEPSSGGPQLHRAPQLSKELGDVAWYVALACEALGYELDGVLEGNVKKLEARYPDGFSQERSRARVADASADPLMNTPGAVADARGAALFGDE